MQIILIIGIVLLVIIIYRSLSTPSNNKFQVKNSSESSTKSYVSDMNTEIEEIASLIKGASLQAYKYFQNKEYDNNIGGMVISNSGDKQKQIDFYYRYQSKIIGLSLVAAILIKQDRLKKLNDPTNKLSKYLLQYSFDNIAKPYSNDMIAAEGMKAYKDPRQLWAYIIVKYERYVPELVELIFDGSPNYDLTTIKEMFVRDVNESVSETFYFSFYSYEWASNKDLQRCGLDFSAIILSFANELEDNDDH